MMVIKKRLQDLCAAFVDALRSDQYKLSFEEAIVKTLRLRPLLDKSEPFAVVKLETKEGHTPESRAAYIKIKATLIGYLDSQHCPRVDIVM